MYLLSEWIRQHVIRLALRHPGLMTAMLFFLLFTVSNYIEFTTGMALQTSPFWHMLLEGAAMSSFGAMLL